MLAPDSTLADGRYRLQERIGAGGMATVWLARDERLGRPVAIKIIADTMAGDDGWTRRFAREARAAAALAHPGVVPVFDYGIEDGRPYLVMEYIPGGSLAQRLGRGGSVPDSRGVAQEILAALAAVHAAGIVHRDVKPGNLLLDEGEHLRLTDFGIAQPQDATSLTRPGMVVGTLRYLAPEVVDGAAATVQSDLFSAGRVIDELAGPDASPEIRVLVQRLTAPEPADRPASALEALTLLNDATLQTRVFPPTEPTRAQPRPSERRAAAVPAATAVREAPPQPPSRPASARPPGGPAAGLRRRGIPPALALAVAGLVVVILVILFASGGGSHSSAPSTPAPAPASASVSQQVNALAQIVRSATRR